MIKFIFLPLIIYYVIGLNTIVSCLLLEDPDEPLFLSELIEAGDVDKARKLSYVSELPNAEDQLESYSGYITVNKKYNSNLFFWFFPSPNKSAPIAIWLQGGPGASSLYGLFVENGPYLVDENLQVILRKNTWSNIYSLLYIDNPVGTGFSFTGNSLGYSEKETDISDNMLIFLRQFYKLFSEYKPNDLYITGESYAGKYIPAIAYAIHKNQMDVFNLKGLIIVDGLIDPLAQFNFSNYLYYIGLFDENAMKKGLEYEKQIAHLIKNANYTECFQVIEDFINGDQISYNSFFSNVTGRKNYFNYADTESNESIEYVKFLNLTETRKALHVGNITFSSTFIVEHHLITDFCQSVKDEFTTLLNNNYKILLFNGQFDIIISSSGTRNLINSLDGWHNKDQYFNTTTKPWYMDNNSKVSGYLRKYENFYYIIINNAGHMVPKDQPLVAFEIVKKFTNNQL